MKKNWIYILLTLFLASSLFTSCEKEKTSGTAYYTFKCVKNNTKTIGDMSALMAIEKEFNSQLSSLDGVKIEGAEYVLSGEYRTCDIAIEKACQRAEDNIENITLEGFAIYEVSARYDNSDTKTIYSHTFGTQE